MLRTHLFPLALTELRTVELTALKATAPPPVPRARLFKNRAPSLAAKEFAFSTYAAPPPTEVAPEASFEENSDPEIATEADDAKRPPPKLALFRAIWGKRRGRGGVSEPALLSPALL